MPLVAGAVAGYCCCCCFGVHDDVTPLVGHTAPHWYYSRHTVFLSACTGVQRLGSLTESIPRSQHVVGG